MQVLTTNIDQAGVTTATLPSGHSIELLHNPDVGQVFAEPLCGGEDEFYIGYICYAERESGAFQYGHDGEIHDDFETVGGLENRLIHIRSLGKVCYPVQCSQRGPKCYSVIEKPPDWPRERRDLTDAVLLYVPPADMQRLYRRDIENKGLEEASRLLEDWSNEKLAEYSNYVNGLVYRVVFEHWERKGNAFERYTSKTRAGIRDLDVAKNEVRVSLTWHSDAKASNTPLAELGANAAPG